MNTGGMGESGLRSNSVYYSLLLYSFLIATSFPVGEAVAGLMPPTLLTCLRFLAASAVFGTVLIIRRQLHLPTFATLWKSAILALLMATFFSLMFKALETTTALNTGALFTFAPLMALCIGLAVNRIRATSRQAACLLIGAVGATWIVFRGDIYALMAFKIGKGEIIFLIGTVSFSFYSPVAKRLLVLEPVPVVTFWVLLFSAVFTGLFSVFEAPSLGLPDISGGVWAAILYLAVFPTAVTFFISTRASTIISPFKVTSFVYLVPAFVAIIQFAAFGRQISLSVVAGIVVTAIATLLVQFDDAKTNAAARSILGGLKR